MLDRLMEMASAVGLDPRAYLHYLFETLAMVNAQTGSKHSSRIGSRLIF